MRARMINIMFVLLLAMTWSAENMTPEEVACRTVCDTPTPCDCNASITPAASVPLYIHLSAEASLFTCTMEPASSISMQKAMLRHRSETENARPEEMTPCDTVRPDYSGAIVRTVDYYVFSLERILI